MGTVGLATMLVTLSLLVGLGCAQSNYRFTDHQDNFQARGSRDNGGYSKLGGYGNGGYGNGGYGYGSYGYGGYGYGGYGGAEVPEVSVCMRERRDRLPSNLAKVLENPKKYLPGPTAYQKEGEREYVIVGGGIAGLTAAYLLLSVGHKVTILESSHRIGGRIYTYRGEGYYGDLGAMRFPQDHVVVMKAFKLFNVPIVNFTNNDEGAQGNYYYINGKYIPSSKLDKKDPKFYRQLYKDFGVSEDKIPKDKDGKYMDPRKLFGSALKNEVQRDHHCRGDKTLHTFLREYAEEKGWDDQLVLMWSTFRGNGAFLPYSLDEFISDSDAKLLKEKYKDLSRLEIVNGSEVFVDLVYKRLKEFPAHRFKLVLDAPVYKIADKGHRVKVFYGEKKTNQFVSGDKVLVTPTARVVSTIEFTKPLPYLKKMALKNLKYVNAAKIFIKFKSAFWAKAENNKAEPILYGEYPGKKAGATGIMDNHLVQVYYPSHPFHGTKLLASYTWDDFSDFWISLNTSEATQLALDELSKVHGPVVRQEFEEAVVYNWNLNPHTHGAFVMHETFQKYNYMEHLMASHGNVLFSGEYTNKEHTGWVEAAMESTIRVLVNENPGLYEKDFKEEEDKFLSRKDRLKGSE